MALSIKPFLTAVVLMVLCASAHAQQSHRFVFVKVEPTPFSVERHDSDLRYSLEFMHGRSHASFASRASELMPIVKYMGLQRPEDLIGRSFDSHLSDVPAALDYFRMQALHNGNYTPPTKDQFFDQLAKGLVDSAKGNCPNTKEMADSHTIAQAMQTKAPRFQADFNARIQKFSNGTMSIVVADTPDINGMIPMCCFATFFLKQGDKPIAKFQIVDAADGFVCTKDWKSKSLSELPSPVLFTNE
jgi:hypothetical protein